MLCREVVCESVLVYLYAKEPSVRTALALSVAALVADANAAYDPLAPAIDDDAPTDVTVRPFVIDRRGDCNAEAWEETVTVMVMVVMVMVVLNKLEERLGLSGPCQIVCDQDGSCIRNGIK